MALSDGKRQGSAPSSVLRERAGKMRWFHALDLGDFQTSGRFPLGTPQNRTLYPVIDLLGHVDVKGLDCLDIGTAHGLIAFGLTFRGARRVTATDVTDEVSPPWALAQLALGVDVEYVTQTTFENILERLAGRQFDIIVCAGVFYHMLNPYDAILKCRRLLRPNGLLFLESAYIPEESRPIMDFNAASGAKKEIYTYWVPSRAALLGMLRLAGFDPLAQRSLTKPDRLAIVARNTIWTEVRGRSEICRRMHEIGLQAASVSAVPEGVPSAAVYNGPQDQVELDWAHYEPDWPTHPKKMDDVVGKTTWMSTNHNY